MPIDIGGLSILEYPHPALRTPAKAIDAVTDEIREIARRMIRLMHEAEGIGLAAPQVGLSIRLFVAYVPAAPGREPTDRPLTCLETPTVYINPKLSELTGPLVPFDEGCLSLPTITGHVYRPEHATIRATDLSGEVFTQSAGGLLARCWQHEYDHLDGVLIIDRMSQMSRLKNRSNLRELQRRTAE